jgi:hypothetical protein
MPFEKDIKNSISCVGVKNINFIGLRIIAKTIRLQSERMISLIEWHTTFIPFPDVASLNFEGYINLGGQIRRRGERDRIQQRCALQRENLIPPENSAVALS